MKIYLIVLVLLISSCINKSEPKTTNAIRQSKTAKTIQSLEKTYYFSDALTYELNENGEKSEIWFYVNHKTKQILYVPNDDMIKAVISFPNGEYQIIGTTAKGKDTVIVQNVPEVLSKDDFKGVAQLIASTKVIDQRNIQQKSIHSQGYRIDYQQMKGGETIHVSTQIPINSRQIYGFCRLNGDAKLNSMLDYLNVLNQQQMITHIEQDNFSLRLLNYGPNPYELVIKD